MKRDPRLPEGDDGRTIVNMNVEGMPWYQKPSPDAPEASGEGNGAGGSEAPYQMTRQESRMYMWGALKAALLVGFIFAAVFFIFIFLLDFSFMH
ncbi:MAG: hypothetical protein IJL78_04515 [Lachnospiraceae bacterium]|nr:hypothetical protein [Lachnospiraceae bacterium]